MSDEQPIFYYEDDDAADPATDSNSVPIAAATFDNSGQLTLSNLRLPRTTETASQQAAAPADNAGQLEAALAAPGPAAARPDDDQPARTGPLIDPLELQIEHHRQVMVAVNEQMRIWDRKDEPVDRNLAYLNAGLKRHFGTPSALPEAPRADPLADQSTQTEQPPAIHQNAQTEVTFEANHRRENDVTFWCKIAISGSREQDHNQFLHQPQPQAAITTVAPVNLPQPQAGTNTVVPVHQVAPPPPTVGARAAATARQSVKGTGAADNAAPLPAEVRGSDPADNAGPLLAPHAPANRPPFNSQALLRAQPTPRTWPPFPSLEEIERRVRQFFAPLPANEDPPILEPIDEATLRATPADQTQPLSFVVNRMSLMPIRSTWDPLETCNGDGEQQCFHCSIRELRIIHANRWISGQLKKDELLKRDLQALLDRHVDSIGHMILLTYAVRLYNKHTNDHALVAFLNEMLASQDFDEDIPKLLAYYQSRMIVTGTKKPWPTEDDFRVAAKRWVGYCQHAYEDIFLRLSGPIIWSPEWMLSKDLPSEARKAFDRIVTNAGTQLDIVRHMVYRHFSLKHILSLRHHFDYEWHRFDDIPDRELLAEGNMLALNETVCLVDKYTLHYFGAALREKVAMHVLPTMDGTGIFNYVLDLYPSRHVKRVILWFGTEYIVDHKSDDFGGLLGYIGHHFASNFGWPELIVIAPPYAHSRGVSWTDNVLGLLVQKDIMLPHARLIIDPHDLQVWRYDYFPTETARASNRWPSKHLKKNGRLRTPHVAEVRKHHLRRYHGLDLWTYYEVDHPTAPMPASILERTANGEFTEPGIVEVGADNAPSETPSTSASIAEQNPSVPDTKAATDAQAAPQPSATSDAAPSSTTDASAIAAPAVNPAASAAIAALEARIAPLIVGLAQLKASHLQPATPMPGPSAPTRSPDTDPEHDA